MLFFMEESVMGNYQLTGKEVDTDFMVKDFLDAIGVEYSYQKAIIKEIDEALLGASKSEKAVGKGNPEYVFISGGHLFIIENKPDIKKLAYTDGGVVTTEYPYRNEYAVNGAIHYSKHIVNKSTYKEVIAIGVVGNKHYYEIQPYYVSEKEVRKLNEVKSFEDFSPENIEEYWNVAIKGLLPKEERELQAITKVAADLHEDLRNYGNLSNDYKATVVSGILLALEQKTFSVDELKGFKEDGAKDGDKVYNAIDMYLKSQEYKGRPAKYGVLLENFLFIKNDSTLNTINPTLGKTPLKYFVEQIEKKVYHHVKNYEHDIDILGKFYGEFVKYGGSDGNSLGIVLTPRHITSLMTELINIQPDDYVLDPACGSGSFLISAMQTMINQVQNNQLLTSKEKYDKIENIKRNHLYGVELQGKLFTIATTNMILRGDGKSNLYNGDMFHLPEEIYTNTMAKSDGEKVRKNFITKVLINPPYSQAKTKALTHLSEISFLNTTLNMMEKGGKLAAIVPISTMVGKSKEEKVFKKRILENNSLETVITLNTDTFYGIGVNPCICILTAGIPHNFEKKRVNFVDFTDDGYEVRKHIGLVANGTEKSKREHLIDVLNGNADDGTKFIVKTTISNEDEWLHNFYYFNDEKPTDEDFEKTIADYLTFQFDMHTHGRGYLFEGDNKDE